MMNEKWTGRLKYRTRGDSKPNNKPNVYFSAHPEDFPIYFDVLAQEILHNSNCAIWYGAVQRNMDDPEHLMDLDQMQLFIFPITTRFLESESVAMHEFRYALEKQIPVLPIALEKGLEKQFMDVFGSLQLIDRTSEDITAMGYEERLSRFLSSVLISDETAQKIREAFDAFVFLSYRKKDRAYAHELMRLIHKSEVWERIGIWYDEFLVPGKDFDEEIFDNLHRCKAFVLSVTASLIEDEENYVEKIEYPAAKKLGMHIFPFMLQKTNLEVLHRRYPEFPNCVNVDDAAQMMESLLEMHAKLAIQSKPQDAIHSFFIGLAYLGGIGAERDVNRAKKLISGAAEEGLPEAMEKLVTMYRNGEGIERDYDEALNWQIRYAKRMEELTKENPSGENRLRLVQAMQNLILYCLEQNRARDAKKYCEELVELAQCMFPEEEASTILLFDDDQFMGIRLNPVLKWLQAHIFLWRIPFYPVLSMILILGCHVVNNVFYVNMPKCYLACLNGQTMYQCTASLAQALLFAAIQYGKIPAKKWVYVCGSVLLTVLAGLAVVVIAGRASLLPNVGHLAYLFIPFFSSCVGWIITKFVSTVLSHCVRK